MKSKTKIGALTLALALAGGALIGCNKTPAPAPEPEKYFVQYTTSSDYNITGINSDGYVKDADVEFRVTVTNEKKEISSVKYDTTTITAVGGLYSFKMPEKDVRLYVTLNNKADLVVTYSGTLKKGQTVTFTVNDQDGDPAEDVSIEGDSSKVEINGTQVKFLTNGEISLTFNGNGLSKEITYTVAEAAHGESIDDPLSVDEAVEIAHELDISFSAKKTGAQYGTPYNVPSELEYYIEGIVNPDKEITFKDGKEEVEPSAAKNVTCYLMGTDFDFEIYATQGTNYLHRNVEAGSRVIVKTHIINFGYGKWTGDNEDVPVATTDKDKGQPETFKDTNAKIYPDIVVVDNTAPTMVSINSEGEKLQLSADAEQPNHTATVTATVLPASVNQAATFSVEDPTVASVEGTTVTGLKEGNTKLIATAGELKDELPVQGFGGAVVPDAGSDIEYPFTVAQARAKAVEIGTSPSTIKYYVRGIVKSIKTGYSKDHGNISLNLVDNVADTDMFIAFQTAITEEQANSIVVEQTVVTVYGPIYNYQGNTPETEGKSASSVVRIVSPEIELTSISINPPSKTLRVDDKTTLEAVPNAGAELGEVTWSVQSGSEYVEVDQTGKVTAKAETPTDTPAVVRVTSNEKSTIYGECEITVVAKGGTVEETATMSYAGSTSQNLTVNALAANAALVGLDGTIFGVNTNECGSYKNKIGLNKDGTIRLYANKADGVGSMMTLSITGGTIKSIKVTLGSTGSLTNLEVKAGGSAVTGSAGEYVINAASLTLQNVIKGDNVQIWISSIVINYVLD